MRTLKKIFKWFFIILVALNLFIIVSGRFYLYKGVWNTYLKGRTGPSIEEYAIFYNRVVQAGNPEEWPKAKNYNRSNIPAALLGNFNSYGTIAYLIVQNDSITHEEYWEGFSDSSHTNSFSMAKTFVGILAGIAVGEGKIKSLDEPVGNYLPKFKEGDNSKLTIRHLLTMSSAVNFDENYANPFAYPAQGYYGTDLEKLSLGYDVTGEPGKVFEYRSGNTELLGLVLEKATGKTISEYFSEKVWKSVGAAHPAFWSLDRENGREKAFCCFNSNAKDFARMGQLYLDSGRWNGKQLVPEEYVLNSIKPAPLLEDDGTANDVYGYSWWFLPEHKGLKNIFYARGILGQYIIVIPEKKMVIVRLGKKREKGAKDEHPADLFWYIDAALQM